MGYYEDVYSSPEKHGLTTVGSVDWCDEPYEFDMTVVWQDEDGEFYWGSDSGCSCPSPFEEFLSKDALASGTFHEMAYELTETLNTRKNGYGFSSSAFGEVANLIGRCMELRRA